MLLNKNLIKHERHPFHLVDPSPWPLLTSIAIFATVLGFVTTFGATKSHSTCFWFFGLFFVLLFFLSRWFTDIIIEGTYEGHHTIRVQDNILLGMKLFIASEVMFFFSFFWAYFHLSLVPSVISGGGVWPPFNIDLVDPYAIPLLNTAILISSGITVTWSQKCIALGRKRAAKHSLLVTILLGMVFTVLQAYEYIELSFGISGTAYGSVFYMITGFHGFHVIVGTIFLIVCFLRMRKKHFLTSCHVGYVCAIWYWHFVDIVWIGLWVIVYAWGGYYGWVDVFDNY